MLSIVSQETLEKEEEVVHPGMEVDQLPTPSALSDDVSQSQTAVEPKTGVENKEKEASTNLAFVPDSSDNHIHGSSYTSYL